MTVSFGPKSVMVMPVVDDDDMELPVGGIGVVPGVAEDTPTAGTEISLSVPPLFVSPIAAAMMKVRSI